MNFGMQIFFHHRAYDKERCQLSSLGISGSFLEETVIKIYDDYAKHNPIKNNSNALFDIVDRYSKFLKDEIYQKIDESELSYDDKLALKEAIEHTKQTIKTRINGKIK
ncbi:MAG: hypothetical protein ACRC0X_06685 [Brevinema sp.]